MTLVSLPSPIAWPGIIGSIGGAPGVFTTATLDAAGEYVSYVFCAREAMTISHVGFRAGTVAGSPTATVSIEGVDATGFPDGAATFGGSSGTTATISSNTYVLTALGGAATVPKGSMFCVKVAYASGTSIIVQHSSLNGPGPASEPYSVINTGTPTKAALSNHSSSFALGSDSTTFYQVTGAFPISAAAGGTFNNTNSAKRGLRFTLTMDCRIIGVRWHNGTSTGDYNLVLYNDAGTELSSSSTAFDGDHNAANTAACINQYFDNAVTGSAGTTYRAVVEPSSATNVNVSILTMPSTDYRSASPAGTTAHYTTFASAAWDDTNTTILPVMDIIIDQIDDGAGTGGGVVGVIGG